MIVLCVFNDASSKIDPIDVGVLCFKCPELECKNLSHNLNICGITFNLKSISSS